MSDDEGSENISSEYTPSSNTGTGQPVLNNYALSKPASTASLDSLSALPAEAGGNPGAVQGSSLGTTSTAAPVSPTAPLSPTKSPVSSAQIEPFPDPTNPDDLSKNGEQNSTQKVDVNTKKDTNASAAPLARAILPPKLENWDEKTCELRPVPPPIEKKLVLPDYVPPNEVDEDFGKKTKKSGSFTLFAYLNAILFLAVGIYALVAGVIILTYRYPIGISGFLSFFVFFIFLCAAVVQLVGFINHPNKPVMHMIYTIIVNFLVFSVFLVAVIQIFMEKNLFEYAKETFKLRFARYQYRFAEADIDKVFDSTVLVYTLIIITIIAAAACVILAMIQCCYYVPTSFWNLICCIILPVCVIVLGITVGVVFLALSYTSTPFSHTNKEDLSQYKDDSPAGGYLSKQGMILLFVAAGLVVYIVVVIVVAKLCYNHDQAKKAEKGLGWPDADEVTYEYFRKNDFVLPFNAVARNALGILLGIVSVGLVIVVAVMLPNKEFKEEDAAYFITTACPHFGVLPSELLSSARLDVRATYLGQELELESRGEVDVREQQMQEQRHTHTLAYQEIDPCLDATESVEKFRARWHPADNEGTDTAAAITALTAMTVATYNLVRVTSVLVVAPLFPVVVMVVLLIVLLLCALCCFSVVSVCICGPSDTRAKIERDMEDWTTTVANGEIKREADHATLRKKRTVLEDRIKAFNKKLEGVETKRGDIDKKIQAWKADADGYQSNTEKQTGEKYDKLQKDKESLSKEVAKFNKEVEKYA